MYILPLVAFKNEIKYCLGGITKYNHFSSIKAIVCCKYGNLWEWGSKDGVKCILQRNQAISQFFTLF